MKRRLQELNFRKKKKFKSLSSRRKHKSSILLTFPKELWNSEICSFLTVRELGNLRVTCLFFHEIVLWKQWIIPENYESYVDSHKKF